MEFQKGMDLSFIPELEDAGVPHAARSTGEGL